MNRQTRLIVILAVMALVGVVALGMIAERYSKFGEGRETGEQTGEQQAAIADRMVDGFIRVRLALGESVGSEAFSGVEENAAKLAFGAALESALSAARVDAADYRELRTQFLKWRHDPELLPSVWRAALDKRAGDLESCFLGDLEELDS